MEQNTTAQELIKELLKFVLKCCVCKQPAKLEIPTPEFGEYDYLCYDHKGPGYDEYEDPEPVELKQASLIRRVEAFLGESNELA